MAIIFMILLVLQSPVDSTLNQQQPYQAIDYKLVDRNFRTSFDPSSGTIYIYHTPDRTIVTLSEEGKVDTLGTIPDSFERLEKMDVSHDGKSIYFWENGIGMVHRYDIATNTMIREDTSHRHRTMFSHAPFLSEGNFIYAIGGYGYWEMRNFLIRYEPEFGQWEKVPSVNDDVVIRSWGGLLYKIGDTFYYFVDETENERDDHRRTYAYRFEMNSGLWNRERELESVFESFSIDGRISNRKFAHTTTHMVDPNNQQLGFLSSTASDENLNLVDTDEKSIYQVNLTSMGFHDVRAAFYSKRIQQWVVLGHEYPISERMRLKVFLFEFDKEHPFVTAYKAESTLHAEALFITTGGLLATGVIGFILFFLFKRRDKGQIIERPYSETRGKKPVEIVKKTDEDFSVFIDGSRFKVSEDPALKKFWKIITELAESGETTIHVSNIDQRIYPDQSHPSQNSRSRKKLIKIINSACGFDLLNEERSKIDKRYKVLTIQIDKIRVKDD